ncbi:peptidoglycan/LPS O-acetylase OafA/YrhL [Bacilli bacterium PM5-9]|nr:peptidoglycan/LPS O-acetylase OafA/YrhL [Bacilli bacterium PM5-9]
MKISSLDGIRGLAVIAVFLGHALYTKNNFPISFAQAGVYYFFILSGFLIMMTFSKKGENGQQLTQNDYYNYFIKRFFRIYPAYFITVVITYLYRIFVMHNSWATPKVLISNLLMLQGKSETPFPFLMASQLWTLVIEVQFYLLLPLLAIFIYAQKTLKKRVIIVVAIGVFSCGLRVMFPYYGFINALIYFDLFCAGMLLSMVFNSQKLQIALRKKETILAVLAIFALPVAILSDYYIAVGIDSFFGFRKEALSREIIAMPLAAITGFSIFYYCIFKNGIINKLFSNKILMFYGNIGYSFYLIHNLILIIIPSESAIGTIAAFCVTTVVSWLSYKYIEQNFIKLGKKILIKE